jgi:hypothetical protein
MWHADLLLGNEASLKVKIKETKYGKIYTYKNGCLCICVYVRA